MSAMWFELKLAWRALMRSPGFALTASGMLCAGLATCMYVFGAIQSFLLRPLPLPEPTGLAHVEYAPVSGVPMSVEIGVRAFIDLESDQTRLAHLSGTSTGTINLSDDDTRPERYNGSFVIGEPFDAYGVPALLGRALNRADQSPAAEPVVLIGYNVWQQRYAGARDVVGSMIRVNGKPTRVVGVMPEGFNFPFDNQVWVPISRKPSEAPRDEDATLEVFGRLADGASMADARDELSALVQRIKETHPETTPAVAVEVKRYQDEFVGNNTRRVLLTMFAAVVFVLLIACANVANLLFARGAAKTRDVAVRSSLGATRWRLALGMIAESLILSFLAIVPALLLANWAGQLTMEALRSSDDPPAFWMTQWNFDWMFALTAVGFALFAGLVAGLLPGLRLARGSTSQAIRDGSAALTSGITGKVLVVAEVAMSLALLVATGLMVRGVLNLEQLDFGARTENVLTARYGLFDTQAPDDTAVRNHQQRVLQAMAAMPGAQNAALTTALPMANTGYTSWYTPEGVVIDDPQKSPSASDVRVDGDFFGLFQIGLQAGRTFDARDDEPGRQRHAAVLGAFARLMGRWRGHRSPHRRHDLQHVRPVLAGARRGRPVCGSGLRRRPAHPRNRRAPCARRGCARHPLADRRPGRSPGGARPGARPAAGGGLRACAGRHPVRRVECRSTDLPHRVDRVRRHRDGCIGPARAARHPRRAGRSPAL